MSNTNRVRRAYRARWNKTIDIAQAIVKEMDVYGLDPDDVPKMTMAELRRLVAELTQSFHEFNAYRNAYGNGAE